MLVEQLADLFGRDGEPIVLGGDAHDALVLGDYGVVLVCHGGANKEPRFARKEKEGGRRRPGAAGNEKARSMAGFEVITAYAVDDD